MKTFALFVLFGGLLQTNSVFAGQAGPTDPGPQIKGITAFEYRSALTFFSELRGVRSDVYEWKRPMGSLVRAARGSKPLQDQFQIEFEAPSENQSSYEFGLRGRFWDARSSELRETLHLFSIDSRIFLSFDRILSYFLADDDDDPPQDSQDTSPDESCLDGCEDPTVTPEEGFPFNEAAFCVCYLPTESEEEDPVYVHAQAVGFDDKKKCEEGEILNSVQSEPGNSNAVCIFFDKPADDDVCIVPLLSARIAALKLSCEPVECAPGKTCQEDVKSPVYTVGLAVADGACKATAAKRCICK